MKKRNAIVVTAGYLSTPNGKTAHGLIRHSDRYNIVGIIDNEHAGKDAGEMLDGKKNNIPIFSSISDFINNSPLNAEFCIVGVATKGGVIPKNLRGILVEALENKMNLVNGLHEYISDDNQLAKLASDSGLEIIDIRRPKKIKDLHFWTGRIAEVRCPKIAVLGTDCALGKRTSTQLLVEATKKAGYKSEMIYTGQTGWMQGAKYGFIFDSTLNDFVSGEMEHAVFQCWQEVKPDIMFVEGQSSLRNPSGPAGSEWLVSLEATAVVLQHDPVRERYKDMEFYPVNIPTPKDEINLIKQYGVPTIALLLNTSKVTKEKARHFAAQYHDELGIQVILPLIDGVDALIPVLKELINKSK